MAWCSKENNACNTAFRSSNRYRMDIKWISNRHIVSVCGRLGLLNGTCVLDNTLMSAPAKTFIFILKNKYL